MREVNNKVRYYMGLYQDNDPFSITIRMIVHFNSNNDAIIDIQ